MRHRDDAKNWKASEGEVNPEGDRVERIQKAGAGNHKQRRRPTNGGKSVRTHGVSTVRILLNMDDFTNKSQCPCSVETISTTLLLIQCSLDRLWILRTKRAVVGGIPLSSLYTRLLGSLHLIIARNGEKAWHYPVNHLQKIGLDVVKTTHVVVVDADFVLEEDLHETICGGGVLEAQRLCSAGALL